MASKPLQRIPSLDGMRAVAALSVFFSHTQIIALYTLLGGTFMSALGDFGVTAFFFLSGFIITTLLRQEFEGKGDLNFRNFYLRRFYRLAPPFVLTMFAMLVLTSIDVFDVKWNWATYFGQIVQAGNYLYLLGDNTLMRVTGTDVIWSLAVENHFYLLFPLLLLTLLRYTSPRGAGVVILLICALLAAWRFVAWHQLELGRDWLRYATDARIDTILAGCCMALWRNPALDNVASCGQAAGTVAVVLCTAAIFAAPHCPYDAISVVFVYVIQSVCLLVIYTLAMQHPEWACFRWLNSRIMIWIGSLSYTIYLIHMMVLKALRSTTDWNNVTVAAIGLILILALAWASYRYVEEPMARLRRRLH